MAQTQVRPGNTRIQGRANTARHPSLLQIDTRVRLSELAQGLGRSATLADFSDSTLDAIAAEGFDWVWMLGVWQTGDAGREVSLHQPEWQAEYRKLLPDFTPDDVCGSPFAISDYVVHRDFGGAAALARLRERLASRGLRLMLDFVPNHTALDHPWVASHPEYYVAGSEGDLAREPPNYRRVETAQGARVLAHGRDPYFPGWPDTLQLNYRHRGLRGAMLGVLDRAAEQCDGVRCDMAMLLLPDVIRRTWGDRARPADGTAPVDASFWEEAIGHVRRSHPRFVFMAEAYWDLEWTLQQQGFDYTYDKRLYDRLEARDAPAVRAHLHADADYQRHSARFIENHDEPRAAATLPGPVGWAAAVITLLAPGLRFVHDGQSAGYRLRTSIHLCRRMAEPPDGETEEFYARLFAVLRRAEVRGGQWRLIEPARAWPGNPTADRFVVFTWQDGPARLLVAVNYSDTQAQCYVPTPFEGLDGWTWRLLDLLHPDVEYRRDGNELARQGLYLDLPPWGHNVFELTPEI